jgi:hypothetical protein
MFALSFEARDRPATGWPLVADELEISEARLEEKAWAVDEEISLTFVLEACLTP